MARSSVEAAKERCEAADARVRECEAALRTAVAEASECRAQLTRLEAAAPAEPAPVEPAPAESAPAEPGLKGAFARKSAVKESKAERREAMEIAELRAMEDPPSWAEAVLLEAARSRADATCTLAGAPFDVLAALACAKQVAKLPPPEPAATGAAVDGEAAVGEWWAARVATAKEPPPSGGAGDDDDAAEEVLVCLGQDGEGRLRGAIGWWPAGALGRAESSPGAANALRCVRIDEAESSARWMQHVSVQGLGEGGKRPEPVGLNVHAPPACHLAEGVRLALLARRQVSARLQRGGAAEAERAHCKLLLGLAQTRLQACAREAADDEAEGELPDDFAKCCSAVQGLRKTLLAREWNPRCVDCGVRHSGIEIHTCRFWRDWAEQARAAEAEAAQAAAA